VRLLAAALCALSAAGCTTMTVPVLRHETGETLGSRKFRVSARFESSRMFSFTEGDPNIDRVAQNSDVFTGSALGLGMTAGLADRVDAQVEGFSNFGGAGWRLGTKVMLLRRGRYGVSVMGGYASNSGSGTVRYLTGGFPVDLVQTLSAGTVDLGVPASVKMTDHLWFYGGLTWFRSGVNGTLGVNNVSAVVNDLGTNLGARILLGTSVEIDLETALLRFYDPFSDSGRTAPYFGLAASFLF
jgi:hypothetical protein